jgi:hypothetical protein
MIPRSTVKAYPMMSLLTANQRFFSVAAIDKATQKLGKSIDKELKYENENYSQLEDIESFLNESGFTFEEKDDEISMKLTKTEGNKTITVLFDAR